MPSQFLEHTDAATQGYADCLFNFKKSMITSTAVIIIISTFVMGTFANLPIVVAPSLGAPRVQLHLCTGCIDEGSVQIPATLPIPTRAPLHV